MCTESIPASSGPGTWSHNLGHSQDEFSFEETLDIAGCPVQEQRMCSLTPVAKLYCGSLLPTAEPKELRRTRPARLAPPEGRPGSSLPREAREPPRTAKCAGFPHGQRCPRLSQLPSIFVRWGNFLLGLLYIYYGEFLLFEFFKKAKFKMVLFFPRHLWVLTRYIIYQ